MYACRDTATNGLRIAGAGGYPADGTPNPNDSLARTNGSNNKVGPALVLKVMSGDKVEIGVKFFYKSGGSATSGGNPVAEILSSLASGIVGASGTAKGTFDALSNTGTSPLLGAMNAFRDGKNPEQTTKPKAYLNWILLDEQLKYVADGSGAKPVCNTDVLNALTNDGPVTIPKNGYLYIYVSNETQNWDVFFDNLSVQHTIGRITEETHYYPFGLTMAGISSSALKPAYVENDKKYNGIELEKDFGLDIYDAQLRELDPQIGRWWQVDPKTEKMEMWSPYTSNYDNPIRYSDPLGDEGTDCCGGWVDATKKWIGERLDNAKQNTLNEIAWVRNRVSDVIDQAGENFKARWAARADPLHQAIDNPFSMIGGPLTTEANVAKGVITIEAKADENLLKSEINSVKTIGVNELKSEIGNEIGILRDAAKGKGNFGLGSADAQTSNNLGKAWVGNEAIVASDGKTLVSKDGLRQYRPPSSKPNSGYATTGVQSNFEWRNKPKGQWQGNGHLNISPAKSN